MIPYDIRANLFELTDQLLSDVIPNYIHQLNEMNLTLDYLWIDNTVSRSLNFSMIDKSIWYYSLDEVVDVALEQGLISEHDREDFLMQYHFKLDLSK